MISDWSNRESKNVHLYTSFDSVASYLELAILSGKFRISEHAQSSFVEYFNIFLQRSI